MKFLSLLVLALAFAVTTVAARADERCVPGTRCLPSLPLAPRFDAAYVCRASSHSGYGYPLSMRLSDRYICHDLGYGSDYRAWAGGNYSGQFVCCFDPYEN